MKEGQNHFVKVVAVLAAIAGLAACSNVKDKDTAATASGSSEKKPYEKTLRITIANGESPFISSAEGQGYYKANGVPVKFENVASPSEAVNAVLLDKLDINTIALIPTLSFIAQGSDLTIFGGVRSEGGEIITTAKNAGNYKDLTSLKGKKVAVIHLDTADYNTRKLLREKSIIPGKDVTYIEVDSYVTVTEAIKKGTVDYGITISEMARMAEQQGLVSVQKVKDLVPYYVCCRQVALTSQIKANRQEYVDLLKAEIQGYKYLKENKDASIKYLASLTGQPEAFFLSTIYSDTSPLFSPEPAKNKVIDFYKILKDEGALTSDVDISQHIDSTLFEDAINQILKEHPEDATYKALYAEFKANNT